jgi:hypothetical protein
MQGQRRPGRHRAPHHDRVAPQADRDAAIAKAQADAADRVRAAEEERDTARKAAAVAEAVTEQAKQEATRAGHRRGRPGLNE